MSPNFVPTAESYGDAVSELLAGYLLSTPAYRWPGVDGMLVEDALREYPAAAAVRAVPGEIELCSRHPELAPGIVAFFFLLTTGCDRV